MASFSVPCPKVSPTLVASSQSTQKPQPIASFPRSDSRSNRALTTVAQFQVLQKELNTLKHVVPGSEVTSRWDLLQGCSRRQSDVFKMCAQLNQVAAEKISNATPALEIVPINKSENQQEIPDESSILTFMTQVKDLVKLVDSKDIVELELKQMDCELIIRKKEALPQPSIAANYSTPLPTHQAFLPPQLPPASAPAPASLPSAPASVSTPPAPSKPKSSHPPFKCPMAGNFYRSPAPGAPPFVKVGDKVQKGQVICIIEAMKLMNEIEADQSGTVVEILVDDGKPVSVDLPLFIIEP
ncbi:Biotin carboxyl carrier protein of acetyl-CoA carboxylase 1, chloroplastic [Sesamum angolense]|uniref:Biotin carboxyl carrier protein of acetyl-CoA carboxylase n=1 Tax=Sesamum angolense TaxID=2727404 RepID=A0AAE1WMA4_9LAMI|nr:Biotin carboxyl carrier protein of acetyl-CoA carboxylase 1, chloroplastic [Sesamum angolense]